MASNATVVTTHSSTRPHPVFRPIGKWHRSNDYWARRAQYLPVFVARAPRAPLRRFTHQPDWAPGPIARKIVVIFARYTLVYTDPRTGNRHQGGPFVAAATG